MEREIWRSISRFESFDLVQRAYQAKHGRNLNAEHTHEILSCFVQARGYLESAAASTEAVLPLLRAAANYVEGAFPGYVLSALE